MSIANLAGFLCTLNDQPVKTLHVHHLCFNLADRSGGISHTSLQGLTNPLPGRPGQAPNWAGQVLFPARRPAGQVKENFNVYKRTAAPKFAYVIIVIFSPLASQFANVNPATFVY